MSSRIGHFGSIQIFGESHGGAVGVVMDGIPAGITLDLERLNAFVQRRATKGSKIATARRESDIPRIVSGLMEGVTTGQPLTALFENADTHSSDYSFLPEFPRPGHADYPAIIRSAGHDDLRGSGHHSGRLTLPYVFAGAVAVQVLGSIGIEVAAHVKQIAHLKDADISPTNPDMEALFACHAQEVPTLLPEVGEAMKEAILDAKKQCDSLGGIVEVVATGVPVGLGAPFFEGVEAVASTYLFSIPAVKAVSFGDGFGVATLRGSEYNDPYQMIDGEVKTTSNHAGGLLGGITNGMPIVSQVAFRPTASIASVQNTVSLHKKQNDTLSVHGRHDPCVAVRAVPVVESALALALMDLWLERRASYPSEG